MSRIDELIAKLCPEGVEYVPIHELFDLRNGYTPSKSNAALWEDGTIPWFRMEDIRKNGRILDGALQRIPKIAVKRGRLFPANSMLVATSATIGEHALVTVPHLSNQRFTSLALKPKHQSRLDMKFVFYYGFVLDEWCRNNITTSSFASVDMVGFKKFRVPVPPLEVQQAIIKILDKFTALEAELEAELEARKNQYDFYRAQLLEFGGDVEWSTLGDVSLKVSSGGTPTKSVTRFYQNGSIPWLRTQEVRFSEVLETQEFITEEAVKETSAKWIPKNCLIVAISGASAGRSAINKIPLTTNQHCCNLQIDPARMSYRFAFHWVSSNYLELKSLGRGARADLNAQIIKDFRIPVPPLDDQYRIVSILDKFDALVNDLSSGLPAEIAARRKQYEYYRDQLLTFKELAS